MEIIHQPVLLEEVIHYLKPKSPGSYIDGTLGGGGHTLKILAKCRPDGIVMGIDLDPNAISTVLNKVTPADKKHLILVQDNFKNIKKVALKNDLKKVDGILLDLGLSSGQLQDHKRGFSFLASDGLDMRFGTQTEQTAEMILNSYSQNELYEIFKNYGEERLAGPIARTILTARQAKPISSPQQVVDIVAEVYHKYYRHKSKTNPATKVFQALRIAVNDEMTNLRQTLPDAVSLLKPGGRLVIISYHSLEDRIVKEFFRNASKDCICAPDIPFCQCDHVPTLKIITKKPIVPTAEELVSNPRSRSAKMRIAEKIKK